MALRQAVLAARDLDAVAGQLRSSLGLGEPFSDPGVEYFGLRNAVFALGDTFLEVVSPVRPDASAARLLDRRGGDCGYMVMFQVEDLAAARARAAEADVREVFAVSLPDMDEVHLHPSDMGGAIVALSTPKPPGAWRWGGPEWERRSASISVSGVTVAVAEPDRVAARWQHVIGSLADVSFARTESDRGPTEISLRGAGGGRTAVSLGGVRFTWLPDQTDS